MKKIIFLAVIILPVILGSCKDDPDGNTIFGEPEEMTDEFDIWLNDNFTTPYNIRFLYKFEHNESNFDYQVTPADRDKAMVIAQLVKFLWLEAYDQIAGVEFTRTYVPRIVHIIGSGAYNTNNTVLLGTAEGGMKITLYRINAIDPDNLNGATLNDNYFRTIHHEFAHILHQTVPFTTDFRKISNEYYIQDEWSSISQTETMAYELGFVSRYARKNHNEDFVENIARYLVNTPENWEALLDAGGSRAIKEEKFAIVVDYMATVWNIDLHELRDEVQRRSKMVSEMDFKTLKW